MRDSQGPYGDPIAVAAAASMETESRRLTPSIGLTHDSDKPADSASNEDFLFHLYRGSELLQDNRVHEAKEELERALHLQPRDSKGQDLLAVVYFRLGLYPRAIQIYEQLRKTNTTDTSLLLNLSLCYLKTGQPALARRDLEHLLTLNSNHSRAWGYLGLACERLGDLMQAEHAFREGGHAQMAKRIAARREVGGVFEPVAEESQPSREVREVAGTAYQELDAGELSFELAAPTSEQHVGEAASQSWRPHEIGSVRPGDIVPGGGRGVETVKPDTRNGPQLEQSLDTIRRDSGAIGRLLPSIPQLGVQPSLNRRPTLIAPVGAPPAQLIGSEYAALDRLPSHQPPSFTLDDAGIPTSAAPSVRRPVVSVPNPFGPPKSHEPGPNEQRTRTLPPPGAGPSAPPPAAPLNAVPSDAETRPLTDEGGYMAPSSERVAESVLPVSGSVKPETPRVPSGAHLERSPSAPMLVVSSPPAIRFPDIGCVLHASGVALVQTSEEVGFAARLEALRAQQSGLSMRLLDRQMKGKSTGESFGGVASPMAMASGHGQMVLAPRPGRTLSAFAVSVDEMCFAREDVLLGFSGALAFENGRLTTGENEFLPFVQLRGEGPVLLETLGSVLTLSVRAERSLSVRREVILGWYGRLVPRAVPPKDAPCGQRGLVSFAGEGRVLIASS